MKLAILALPLYRRVPGQLIVIELPANAEPFVPETRLDVRHLTHALDSQLAGGLIEGREQNFNPNVGSDGRAFAANDERSIPCHVSGKPALCVVGLITPMEDDGQAQLVARRRSRLRDGDRD